MRHAHATLASSPLHRVDLLIRTILDKMRYDGCGGRAGRKAELLTGIEGVSSKPVRKIVLREGRNGAASS